MPPETPESEDTRPQTLITRISECFNTRENKALFRVGDVTTCFASRERIDDEIKRLAGADPATATGRSVPTGTASESELQTLYRIYFSMVSLVQLSKQAYTESDHGTKVAEWILDTSLSSDKDGGRGVGKGLKYDVWVHESIAGLQTTPAFSVVIAFRGTRSRRTGGFSIGDWYSNFRWITRFIPFIEDHYDRLRKELPDVTRAILEKHPAANIISTGHSLGGGLAQQAVYASPDIRNAVGFAPSPVTGFFSVPREERERNKTGTVILRAYERGEILATVRTALKQFTGLSKQDPLIAEVAFNLSTNPDPVNEHAIEPFATNLVNFFSSQTAIEQTA